MPRFRSGGRGATGRSSERRAANREAALNFKCLWSHGKVVHSDFPEENKKPSQAELETQQKRFLEEEKKREAQKRVLAEDAAWGKRKQQLLTRNDFLTSHLVALADMVSKEVKEIIGETGTIKGREYLTTHSDVSILDLVDFCNIKIRNLTSERFYRQKEYEAIAYPRSFGPSDPTPTLAQKKSQLDQTKAELKKFEAILPFLKNIRSSQVFPPRIRGNEFRNQFTQETFQNLAWDQNTLLEQAVLCKNSDVLDIILTEFKMDMSQLSIQYRFKLASDYVFIKKGYEEFGKGKDCNLVKKLLAIRQRSLSYSDCAMPYQINLFEAKEPVPQTIYLSECMMVLLRDPDLCATPKPQIQDFDLPRGLKCQMLDSKGDLQTHVIPRAQLPADFPTNLNEIFAKSLKTIPVLLERMSNEKHIHFGVKDILSQVTKTITDKDQKEHKISEQDVLSLLDLASQIVIASEDHSSFSDLLITLKRDIDSSYFSDTFSKYRLDLGGYEYLGFPRGLYDLLKIGIVPAAKDTKNFLNHALDYLNEKFLKTRTPYNDKTLEPYWDLLIFALLYFEKDMPIPPKDQIILNNIKSKMSKWHTSASSTFDLRVN